MIKSQATLTYSFSFQIVKTCYHARKLQGRMKLLMQLKWCECKHNSWIYFCRNSFIKVYENVGFDSSSWSIKFLINRLICWSCKTIMILTLKQGKQKQWLIYKNKRILYIAYFHLSIWIKMHLILKLKRCCLLLFSSIN